jgi:hypothetical protein
MIAFDTNIRIYAANKADFAGVISQRAVSEESAGNRQFNGSVTYCPREPLRYKFPTANCSRTLQAPLSCLSTVRADGS